MRGCQAPLNERVSGARVDRYLNTHLDETVSTLTVRQCRYRCECWDRDCGISSHCSSPGHTHGCNQLLSGLSLSRGSDDEITALGSGQRDVTAAAADTEWAGKCVGVASLFIDVRQCGRAEDASRLARRQDPRLSRSRSIGALPFTSPPSVLRHLPYVAWRT